MNQINFEAAEKTVQAIQKDPSLKMRKWTAQIKWLQGVQNEVKVREFQPFHMDEPATLGGTDVAPNPVEMLIAAAGSCFAITFEVLASQNGIVLKEVSVNVEADLNAAVFLGLEEGYGGIFNPSVTIKAVTSASENEVRQIAKQALAKSPVLASLKHEVQLRFDLVGE
ncbi:MAG: OsmC family protein [Clostridia bacterium]